ncbi:MAG: peptidoglycan recognition family protein [Verrucomicrobiales bacterium]
MAVQALPLGALAAIGFAGHFALGGARVRSAGFALEGGLEPAGRFGSYLGVDAARASEPGAGAERSLQMRIPSTERPLAVGQKKEEILVSKTGGDERVDFNALRREWKYLTRRVRAQIDRVVVVPGRWKLAVVHNSATDKGNAKAFDFYHRNVKMLSRGLAYHFVIGNGSYSSDGEIEVGRRWAEQFESGPLVGGDRSGEAIGICLVGDFNRNGVGRPQLEALDELTDYLEARIGVLEVTTHEHIEGGHENCPGRYFPDDVLGIAQDFGDH